MTPWTIAHQFPLSMEFSRQEYWSELLFPSLGDLPNPGIEPGSPALQSDSLPPEPPGKLKWREGKGRTRVKQKLDRCLNCQAPESFWVNSSCAIQLHQSAKIGFKVRSRKAEFYLSFTDKVRQNDVLRKGGWMEIESFFPYKDHHCYI